MDGWCVFALNGQEMAERGEEAGGAGRNLVVLSAGRATQNANAPCRGFAVCVRVWSVGGSLDPRRPSVT